MIQNLWNRAEACLRGCCLCFKNTDFSNVLKVFFSLSTIFVLCLWYFSVWKYFFLLDKFRAFPYIFLFLPILGKDFFYTLKYDKSLLRDEAVNACMLNHVWVLVALWTVARQAPLSMGFSRQEYPNGLPFPSPEDLPNPGTEPMSLAAPALQAVCLPLSC